LLQELKVSEQSPEQKRKVPTIAIVGIILGVLCGISLYIRIYLPHDQIFVNGAVWFRETDAYYYMRNIEILVHNFPHYNTFDPYMLFPGGGATLVRPFFAWLVSGIILLVSHGIPTLHSMEVIGAYMPTILGTLVLIPVYFIGKELFNRWAGVIAAALVVILPTEFLHRSLLGFTDHHVAETLFSTVAILFLIMAIKRARGREISFGHVLNRDWPAITKPLVYTLLAGIFLGLYLLSWQGGLMFIFIIFLYLVIQFVVDHLRRKSTDYLCIIGTPLFLVALLMLLPILGSRSLDTMSRVSLLIAILVPIVLSVISRLMAGRALKPVYYVLVLLGLTGIGLAVLHAVNPSLFQSMLGRFNIFTPTGARLTIMEVTGLLFPYGTFTLSMAWANFTTSFFIAFIALVMLIYATVREKRVDKLLLLLWTIILLITVVSRFLFGWLVCFAMLTYFAIKEERADRTLFVVWSIIMLAAVLGQRRFGYYYTVNVALLTGYFSWKMLDLAGLGKLLAKPKEVVEAVRVKKFKKKKKQTREKAKPKTFIQPRGAWINVIIAGIALFFLVIFPSVGLWKDTQTHLGGGLYIGYTKPLAQQAPIMDRGWYNSTLWLKDNSPEPFGDPDFYYELYPPKNEFVYPDTAYGVMSWWDYGYFIMQLGHRIPNANPGQAGAVQAGKFFTAWNETSANVLADELGTKYVMIDQAMATGKFYAMAEWAGKNATEFYQGYVAPVSGDALQALSLYYPAYYNSTVARLYNFDNKAVVPSANSTLAISWEWRTGDLLLKQGYKMIIVSQGRVIRVDRAESYRVILTGRYFSDCEEAEAYVSTQQPGNYDVGGLNPFATTMPLEALASYERVYPDPADTTASTAVKIFKYLGSDDS
jgi:asparagine N-glycosylation enzyme membrane subunit Stt3